MDTENVSKTLDVVNKISKGWDYNESIIDQTATGDYSRTNYIGVEKLNSWDSDGNKFSNLVKNDESILPVEANETVTEPQDGVKISNQCLNEIFSNTQVNETIDNGETSDAGEKDIIKIPASIRRRDKLESIANKLLITEMYNTGAFEKKRINSNGVSVDAMTSLLFSGLENDESKPETKNMSRSITATDSNGATIVLVMSDSEDDDVSYVPSKTLRKRKKNMTKMHCKNKKVKSKIKEYGCPDYDEDFEEKKKLKVHQKTHETKKRHVCVACEKSYSKLSQLVRHKMVHAPPKKQFICHLCTKKFLNQTNLDNHLRVHAGERPYACTKCDMAFTQHGHLTGHNKIHMEVKPHPCSYCGKRFTRRSDLANHVRTHTGEKPFLCTICGRDFIQRAHLDCHVKTHSGEKPHQCEECGKHFTRKTDVTRHMRIHTGARPFVCEVCGKGFAQSSQYTTHSRVHTGAKPFSCPNCQRKFAQSANRKKHIKICKKKPPMALIPNEKYSVTNTLDSAFHETQSEKPKGSNDVLSFQEMLGMELNE